MPSAPRSLRGGIGHQPGAQPCKVNFSLSRRRSWTAPSGLAATRSRISRSPSRGSKGRRRGESPLDLGHPARDLLAYGRFVLPRAAVRAGLTARDRPQGTSEARIDQRTTRAVPARTSLIVTNHAPAAVAPVTAHRAIPRPLRIRPEQNRLHRRAAMSARRSGFLRRLPLAALHGVQSFPDEIGETPAFGAEVVFVGFERAEADAALHIRYLEAESRPAQPSLSVLYRSTRSRLADSRRAFPRRQC